MQVAWQFTTYYMENLKLTCDLVDLTGKKSYFVLRRFYMLLRVILHTIS